MTKHTPGPWAAYEISERCPLPIGVPVEVGTAAGKGSELGTICEIVAQGDDGKYSSETTAANARLIAASPTLLAACKVAYNHIMFKEDCDTVCVLEKAIKDAEGVSHA